MRENKFTKSKLVCTWGPAITQKLFDLEALKNPSNAAKVDLAKKLAKEVLASGNTVVRQNFSHGSLEEHKIRYDFAKNAAKELGLPISMLCDTKGPELRLLEVDGEPTIDKGKEITIHCLDFVKGNANEFSISTKPNEISNFNISKYLKVGGLVLVDDGKLQLLINKIDVDKGLIYTVALNNHYIKTKKRLNLPHANYNLGQYISEYDAGVIKFACENNYDYIAPSFVSCKQDIDDVKAELKKHGKLGKIKIISKPENQTAITNIDEIIENSDGIMVPRGDLGLEVDYFQIPYYEKYMIDRCRELGKPVIVATQMLDSMEHSPIPTRAEVTDVFYASNNGTDATMTSGETAQGQFPVRTVQTMNRINLEGEMLFDYKKSIKDFEKRNTFSTMAKKVAIDIAKKTAFKLNGREVTAPVDFVVINTDSEEVIKAISNIRPGANVIVITTKPELYTAFGVYYGIRMYLGTNNSNDAKNAVKLYSNNAKGIKAVLYSEGKFNKV
ncbi:MAG: pyruvate kinase [Mycoplasmataceae bacterium]|jgi:pyruvate kinase|nr:pyruvate kinase [Mycoplasmataceae bacterium]